MIRFLSTCCLLCSPLLAGNALAEDHFIQHGGTVFNPPVLTVEPGDVVQWGIGFPGGSPRTITSGEDCIPDGLWFDGEIPPGLFTWEVPLDIGVTEVPYFNRLACTNGEPGLLRIIDIRRVPSEYPTIQEALDAADPYDTILIAPGTYFETFLVPSDDHLLIKGELDAEGDPAVVIGPKPGSKLTFPTMSVDGVNDLRIEGIHFNGGRGGGVVLDSASASIDDCLFTDNASMGGGGLACLQSTVSIADCRFDVNTSGYGGGVLTVESDVSIVGCDFNGNRSTSVGDVVAGGAIAAESGTLSILDCRFEGNDAESSGGAIALASCQVTILDSHLEGNATPATGGAIDAVSGTLEVLDTVIRGNVATAGGGGIHLDGTTASIGGGRVCGNSPDQIVGDWTDVGGVVVRDDCSILSVPEDFPTIGDAVEAARDGDTIMIAAGDYPLSDDDFFLVEDTVVSIIGETNADGSPAVNLGGSLGFNGQGVMPIVIEDLKMASLGLYDCTATVTNCLMVDGQGNFAGVLVNQARATLIDCRIADGSSGFLPGGVYITDQIEDGEIETSDVDLIDCVIENNTGGCPFPNCGGNAGVRIERGIVDFVRCTVRNNAASGYGGISMASRTDVSLTDTTVCGNSSPGQINGNWTDNGGNTVIDECPEECPGDFNHDGSVDGGDLGFLLAAWGGPDADLDGDGNTDGGDLGLFLSVWGPCP